MKSYRIVIYWHGGNIVRVIQWHCSHVGNGTQPLRKFGSSRILVQLKFVLQRRCGRYIGSTPMGNFSSGGMLYRLLVLADCISISSYAAPSYSCSLSYSFLSFSSELYYSASDYILLFSLVIPCTAMSSSDASLSSSASGQLFIKAYNFRRSQRFSES